MSDGQYPFIDVFTEKWPFWFVLDAVLWHAVDFDYDGRQIYIMYLDKDDTYFFEDAGYAKFLGAVKPVDGIPFCYFVDESDPANSTIVEWMDDAVAYIRDLRCCAALGGKLAEMPGLIRMCGWHTDVWPDREGLLIHGDWGGEHIVEVENDRVIGLTKMPRAAYSAYLAGESNWRELL